jgi:outer membrane receptor protein involved in Fe transport
MGFTKSLHFVLSYDKVINKNLRIKSEIYYQHLFNVPIENKAGSSFSLLNMGSGFERFFPDTLVNKGTGKNYGIEFTLEKFFSKGFYYMLTGSLYNSKATGNDGIERNTDFNGNFVINALGGYEKAISKKSTFTIGAKITYGGGKRYSDYDLAKSKAFGDGVIIESSRNIHQTKEYFRADLKLGIRINAKKVAHEVAIDIVNIFSTQNILGFTYNPDKNNLEKKYQLGFLPLFYYKVDF